ncbi:MAG: PAS domain S-box protein, partial [Rhodothermales bacterium]
MAKSAGGVGNAAASNPPGERDGSSRKAPDRSHTLEQDRATLEERTKELRCLYAVERTLRDFDDQSESSLQDIAMALCSAFPDPGAVGVRIHLGDRLFTTSGYRATEARISCPIVASGQDVGEIEVVWTGESPHEGRPRFSQEKSELVAVIAGRVEEAWWRRHQTDHLQLLGTALNAAANGVVITDRDGIILWVNPAFSAGSGYTSEEAVGRTPRELIASGEQDEAFYEELWQTILRGEVWRGELINRRKDGSLFREAQTITPVCDPNGRITHFIAVKVDITEQVKLQEDFLQAQKMEAVGRLAGGIAHDFNNLLTVIRGHSEFILEELDPDSRLSSDLQEVLQEVARASELTRQLLGFSRKQVMVATVFDLSDAA